MIPVLIAVPGMNRNGIYFDEAALKGAVALFGCAVCAWPGLAHPEAEFPDRLAEAEATIAHLIGAVVNPRYKERFGLVGEIHFSEPYRFVEEEIRAGLPLGVSLRARARYGRRRYDGKLVEAVETIREVLSLDLVKDPAAGARFLFSGSIKLGGE